MITPNDHLHLVSDSTGETLISITRATLGLFEDKQPTRDTWFMVRTDADMDVVIRSIEEKPGLVLYTLVDGEMRDRLDDACNRLNMPSVAVLDPVLKAFSAWFGRNPNARPGRQHALDNEYFNRIEAMDFTLAHDDGIAGEDLYKADVVLVGISRTSKTPTCIYLANRGIKAANVPYVPGIPLPPGLTELKKPLIVGLIASPERIVSIRRNRLLMLNENHETSYADTDSVKDEIREARRFFNRQGWPVLDVSKRSIEETSAAIIKMLQERQLAQEQKPD